MKDKNKSILWHSAAVSALILAMCSVPAKSTPAKASAPARLAKPLPSTSRFKILSGRAARIGQAIDLFSLPLLDSSTRSSVTHRPEMWDSRDELGWRSIVFTVFGRGQRRFWQSPAGQQTLHAWLQKASEKQRHGVDVVAVFGDESDGQTALSVLGSTKSQAIPFLLDAQNVLSSRIDFRSAAPALLSMDRAGFLRRVQAVDDLRQLPTLLSETAAPTPAIAENQAAPDFEVRDMNGQVHRLNDYRGHRNLLLTFFPKCFTGGCTVHLSSLRDAYLQLQTADVDVLAVSVDGAEGEQGQKAFSQMLNLPFTLVPDTGRNLSILYGAANSPNQVASRISVLIDKNGVVRWIDKQINPQTHGADVLAKAEELGLIENSQNKT